MITATQLNYIAEQSKLSINERISKIVNEKVRQNCCANNTCEGLCNVAVHEYKMFWVKEWQDYAKQN